MKTLHKRTLSIALAAAFVLLLAVGAVASAQGGPGGSSGNRNGAGLPTTPLTATEIEALNRVLQDEYHAGAVYDQVIADLDETAPFVQIREAEARHADAVERLFSRYNLQLPENQWAETDFPTFESLQAACAIGAEAERANADLYDWALANTAKRDLTNVFTNLKTASLESHLPAFETCDPTAAPLGSGPYGGQGGRRGVGLHSQWNDGNPLAPRWQQRATQQTR